MLCERLERGKSGAHAKQEKGTRLKYRAGLRNWPVRRSLPDRLFSKSWLLPCGVFLCSQFFVSHGLGMHDDPVWSFRPVRPPEVKDDAIGLSRSFRDLLGLFR